MSEIKRDANNKILPWECPTCHNITTDYPALSRKDNKTNICSACGTKEALDEWFKNKDK